MPLLSPFGIPSAATAVDTTAQEDKKCHNQRRYQNDEHITGEFTLAVIPILVWAFSRKNLGPAGIVVTMTIFFAVIAMTV